MTYNDAREVFLLAMNSSNIPDDPYKHQTVFECLISSMYYMYRTKGGYLSLTDFKDVYIELTNSVVRSTRGTIVPAVDNEQLIQTLKEYYNVCELFMPTPNGNILIGYC